MNNNINSLDGNAIYDNAGAEQLTIIESIREQLKKLNISSRNVLKNILEDKNIISDPVQVQGVSAYPDLEDIKALHQNYKEVTVADLAKQESEVTYVDLMKRKKKVKKKTANFDEINLASDENEDEFYDASEVSEVDVLKLPEAVKFDDE